MKAFQRICSFLILGIILSCLSMTSTADTVYQTYTYSSAGKELLSPDAYTFEKNITGIDLGVGNLSVPSDLCTDDDGNVYIADTKNNRILFLNKNFQITRVIHNFINPASKISDKFNGPEGLFVAKEYLYVADTQNQRIVVFHIDNAEAVRVLEKPDSKLLSKYIYTPKKIAVDNSGRIYVIAGNINAGIVELDSDGNFISFFGAKRVSVSATDLLWRYFMTSDQKAASKKFIPTTYNNIAIDEIGFLYVTTDTFQDWQIRDSIAARSTSPLYAPVCRLNAVGNDILKRQGFFPPVGEINFQLGYTGNNGPSKITDVALSEDGSYSLLDSKRGKIFTYDESGNLIYIFGGKGAQQGLVGSPAAISYQNNHLVVLDSEVGKLVIYQRTQYGDLLSNALKLNSQRKYDLAVNAWRDVLKYNNNCEIAYAAMGQNYIMNSNYEAALQSYRHYKDIENYSMAFAEVRKAILHKIAIPLIFGIIVLVILLLKFNKFIKRINNNVPDGSEKHKLWRQIAYAQYIVFHPFDGFYDMKHEYRGSVLAASCIFVFTVFSFIIKSLCTGYIFNSNLNSQTSVIASAMTIMIPFLLWCIANWCLTTLMDGKGRFKDIYMATCYALTPIALINIPYAILSNVLTLPEGTILNLLITLFYAWSVFLIVIGCLVIHDYPLGKSVLVIILTVIGMAVILFIALLFGNVIQKMLSFIVGMYNEISFR